MVGNHGDGENRDGAHALNEIPVVTVFGSSMPGLEIMMHAKIGVNSAGTIATHYTGTSSNAKWFTVLRFTRAGAGGGGSGEVTGGVARAVFCLKSDSSTGLVLAPNCVNIDRIEKTSTSSFSSHKIFFTNPIEDPVFIVPPWQPAYDSTPFDARGESRRINEFNNGPRYVINFQDNSSNVALSIQFTGSFGTNSGSSGISDTIKHFVIF